MPTPRTPFRTSPRTSIRSRLVSALAAVALALPVAGVASTVGLTPGLTPSAAAQSAEPLTLDEFLHELDPSGELEGYVDDALGGINGPLGAPGPPAPVHAPVNCSPTPEHPQPVILVHGTFDNGPDTMPRLGAPLVNEGFCVVAPTLGAYAGNPERGGLDSIVGASAPQLAGVIDHVRAVTGADKVDLLGYSQGAAIAGYTTKMLRPDAVDSVVSVGGYWGADNRGMVPQPLPPELAGVGLWAANLRGLSELAPGSPMVAAWHGIERSPYLPGVEYTLIATRGDQILPPSRSFVPGPGVRTLVTEDVCGGAPETHGGMASDPRTHALVSEALGGAGGC